MTKKKSKTTIADIICQAIEQSKFGPYVKERDRLEKSKTVKAKESYHGESA